MTGFTASLARPAALAVLAVALSAFAGVAFAGWMEHAPAIFMALVDSGLSWCF
ncbi:MULTISPECIES: hypothetical protein [unclassified Aminobacter]|uniref:hypothetical protein n=1 Tax=unclassified Aminobacter TaxID=2644704 RepID=UPI0004B3C7C5|nr:MULTISPECIES: hypothetical protein [unclassified Aminobacter]TWG64774.1 hypothetical protein L610_001600000560 [Aminobacter sp. J44]TWH36722.1 hypothetical protein L611_000100002040 [Aminobacter sp. J15]